MADKKGKKAVIISNIRSNSIEQAIFILKSDASEASNSPGSGIVAEAQEIIDNYIKKVERSLPGDKKRKNRRRRILAILSAFIISVLGGLILFKI